ncbi:DUF5988 family protein (plasmid) [Streptomyces goshikiensis]|uniref:DUF5988 family protein n=1 Tax=Streptomyces goshikiensis TaxID=1942 RepID=A0ABZ1RXB0_9ACTN|nr:MULTISPECIES: DUF5988 family protein [Streptomyces]MBP0932368.1 hypothetical protein [Streptomyces sp. KCTC 0041BP]PJN17458.1 hypothetical protein CG724_17775 [Streptomyces sp. CB02120-2]RPK29248.1 hypothetical protein EES37_34995 [Streptomyces sp. ADI91-18]GHD75183.1 hypothetical protein GCM10010336_50410 [Streptomyces goshikiensis]
MSELISVMLAGGPDWAPVVWSVKSVEGEPKVKILCGNAYEHFEFSGFHLVEGEQRPVYRWSCRTYVAE